MPGRSAPNRILARAFGRNLGHAAEPGFRRLEETRCRLNQARRWGPLSEVLRMPSGRSLGSARYMRVL
eukprot:9355789-Pyramimonas_sp.AAC.1